MSDFQTMKIHGKDYVMVDERLRHFHETYPNGAIETSVNTEPEFLIYLQTNSKPVFVVRAVVIPDISVPERYFTGHAYEVEGSNNINDGSALENCETSAVGRALGLLGIGLIGGIASADEMQSALMPKQNGNSRSSNVSSMEKPSSEAQRNFISSLRASVDNLEEVDTHIETLVKDKENFIPTSLEASSIIEYLKGLPKKEAEEDLPF